MSVLTKQLVIAPAVKRVNSAGHGAPTLLTRACRDSTRQNSFKRKERRLRLGTRKKIPYFECGEALEQVAQKSCGCPIPGSVQSQLGGGSKEPGWVEGVPLNNRGVGTRCSLKSPPTQVILWFYSSIILSKFCPGFLIYCCNESCVNYGRLKCKWVPVSYRYIFLLPSTLLHF